MTKRILEILDNVRYWDTCPDEYKKDIETFLEAQNKALRIHDVVGRSEQLLAFKKWEAEKCKLPWDASPEQIVEQYLSR
jgi:hypothetical protein